MNGERLRYGELDALRGVAALVVVLFHSYNGGGLVPNGFLAVDLFFILSGFVIAHSYEAKLSLGMRCSEFFKRRAIRLYPMLVIGAGGGLLIAIAHKLTHADDPYSYHAIMTSGGLSLFGLPYLVPGSIDEKAYSFNPVIWSLFFEVVVNIAYVLILPWLTTTRVWSITGVSLAAVCIFGMGGGTILDFYLGVPRVFAGFFSGVALYRLHKAGIEAPQLPRAVPYFVLFAMCLYPWPVDRMTATAALCILILIVFIAANITFSSKIQTLLGEISYPIYLIHWLTLYIFTAIGKVFGLTGTKYIVVVIVHLLALPLIGLCLYRFYEEPVMKALKSKFCYKNLY